jgi:cytosine/adenosine deaminase-related metal-dependent hydrolase
MPQLWDFYQSSRENHGSYFYDWTTAKEVKWRNFYWKFMRLMNDYKNMGGRVTTGSDSGFIFETYGFGYIQELELLQEAGFNPLQVVTSATLNGALTLADPKGAIPEFGTLRVNKLADLVAAELQNTLRHGRAAPERSDSSAGTGRRRQLHGQRRYRLRREEVVGGSRRHGRRGKEKARPAGSTLSALRGRRT